jgi:hypothetical protein
MTKVMVLGPGWLPAAARASRSEQWAVSHAPSSVSSVVLTTRIGGPVGVVEGVGVEDGLLVAVGVDEDGAPTVAVAVDEGDAVAVAVGDAAPPPDQKPAPNQKSVLLTAPTAGSPMLPFRA